MSDTAPLAELFIAFAEREARGSSPLYDQLCAGLASRDEVLGLLFEAPPAQRRPNLLLAAVHYLLLAGTSHPLADHYPSLGGDKTPDARVVDVFADFCAQHRDAVVELLRTRATQTNEVGRSAMLMAALNQIETRAPIGLVDIGASAGLNLLCDRYRIAFGEHAVGPADARASIACDLVDDVRPARLASVPLAARVGIDPAPLDASDPDDRRWLQACVWPEHHARRRLLDAALSVAAADPPEILRGDAFALPEALDRVPPGMHVCVFHSATLAYVPPDDRAEFSDLLEEIARSRPLSWISLEGPFLAPFDRLHGDASTPPPEGPYMLLGHTEWQEGRRYDRLLGRADPHGRWLQWLAPPT